MRRLLLVALALAALIGWLAWSADRHPVKRMPPTAFVNRAEAEQAVASAWREFAESERQQLGNDWRDKTLAVDGKVLRWLEQRFGDKPAEGWSLFISLHGGGGAPAHVNDQQWRNQIRLYQHPGAIFVAPRAPTDNWNLWHESHIDGLLDRLIAGGIVTQGVNPDRVYLLGYSAGGDGVYQLAPRLADRFAAASMMAGHPNEASPIGLRNLPFAIWCGAEDKAYNRNRIAAEWLAKLDELAAAEPGAYVHSGKIVPGKGHWMELEDRAALTWMAGFTRNPWPKTVVWRQDDVTHDRFYWLGLPNPETAKAGQVIRASVEGQVIEIQTADVKAVDLWLSDQLLDLDRPVVVKVNGKVIHDAQVHRHIRAIHTSLGARMDPRMAATAVLNLSW